MVHMKFSAAVAAIVAATATARPTCDDLHAMNYEYDFETYIVDFNKSYLASEAPGHRAAFEGNMNMIKTHNTNPVNTWKMGVNAFADLTAKEFAMQRLGFNKAEAYAIRNTATCEPLPDKPLPDSLDWRTKNVVTPPKNQEACGSCWAFSTAETLESHIAIKTGKLMTFSEQEFVDCVPNPNQCGGTGGCQGATQWLGFQYAMEHGVTLESDYPYTARTGTCQPNRIKPVANITGYCRLPHVSENYTAEQQYNELMQAVSQVGPIAISASAEPWQLYERGVFSSESCGGDDVDHAIQLVGYGTDDGILGKKDYWLVRNSWGEAWGEKGYIRIERLGAKGTPPCEMDKTPGDGTACKGSPSEIKVCGICGILSDSSYPTGGHLV